MPALLLSYLVGSEATAKLQMQSMCLAHPGKAWLTLAPSGLLTNTQFLDRKALEQAWPNKTSLFTSEMSKDGLRLAPIAHRTKEATASGAGHSADTWNPSDKHVGSRDQRPGFLLSSVLAAPKPLPTT